MATPRAPEPQARGIPADKLKWDPFPLGTCSDGSMPLVCFSVPAGAAGPRSWHARLVSASGADGREVPARVLRDTSVRLRLDGALARVRAALGRCRPGGRRWKDVRRIEARVLRCLRRDAETFRAVAVVDPAALAGFPGLRFAPAPPPRHGFPAPAAGPSRPLGTGPPPPPLA